MFSDEFTNKEYLLSTHKVEKQEEPYKCIINVCIPKLEPGYLSISDSNRDVSDQIIAPAPIPYTTPFKVRDPVVLLERCDKIWETMKLIKNVQSINNNINDNGNTQGVVDTNSSTSIPNMKSNSSYIKYQPVLGNNNVTLPNFTFSVKTRKKVYQCLECGKHFAENRSLRHHSQRIHGIIIPYKRRKKYINPLTEKNVETDEKSKIVDKKQEHQEDKQHVDVAPTSMSSSMEVAPAPKILQRAKRIRKSSSAHDNYISNINEISKPEHHKSKSEMLVQQPPTENKLNLESECMLCKKTVKDIRKHLIDYHKIGCIKTMLNGLETVLSSPASITIKTTEPEQIEQKVRNENIQKISDQNAQQKSPISESKNSSPKEVKGRKRTLEGNNESTAKRRKLNNNSKLHTDAPTTRKNYSVKGLEKDVFKCDICLGIYMNYNSFCKHRQFHYSRGETKENFHLFKDNCKYVNSPLRSNFNITTNLRLTFGPFSEENNNKEQTEKEQISDTVNTFEKSRSSKKEFMKTKIVCTCGRAFRNPHTLFVHKGKCEYSNGLKKRAVTKSSTDDGLTENGISITIKKKNDSYEIVGRDSSDDNNSKDASLDISKNYTNVPKDNTKASAKDKSVRIQESSKYSKHHSILKLQSVEEDIVVDIEEDSQNYLLTEVKNDSKTSKEGQPTNFEKSLIYQKVPSLRVLSERALGDSKQKERANDMNSAGGKTDFVVFRTRRSTKNKNIPQCTYRTFDTSTQYENHQCTIAKG